MIGYSGGGGVAVLVAARRSDVATIRTVAGNLDHIMVNHMNNVSQMAGSLNAIDQAQKVQDIPQLHFSGSDDETIAPSVAKHFIETMSSHRCARALVIKGATHEKQWEQQWENLLRQPVECH